MGAGKAGFKVVGPAVVVKLEAGGERYLYEGTLLSTKGFAEASLKHAEANGLIEFVELGEQPADDSGSGTTEDEAPSKSWNLDRIDAWAAAQEPPIEFTEVEAGKALTKAQKLEQIAAEVAKRSAQ